MKDGRRHSRTKLERNCYLIGKDGESYHASLADISLSGALINVVTENHFKIGDLCDFVLNLKTAELPIKRPCKIVRLDNKIIGVEYIVKLITV